MACSGADRQRFPVGKKIAGRRDVSRLSLTQVASSLRRSTAHGSPLAAACASHHVPSTISGRMRLALVLLSVVGAAHAMKVGNTFVKSRANELDDEIGLNCDTTSAHNSWATGSAGPCGPGMVAAAPAARKAVASLLRGGSFAGDSEEAAVPTPPDATSSADAPAAGASGLQSAAPSSSSSQGGERAKEQLTLSPERLAQIGRLSDVLTPISEELAMVPAFTVTVGNTSAPLTIPHGDGERLAYFFVE